MAKPAAKKDAKEEAPKKSKKMLIILVAAVVLAAVGGAAGWYFLGPKPEHGAKKEEPPKPPVFLPLDTFTVNLPPEGSGAMLQTTLVVQVAEQHDADALTTYMPLVRSQILQLLAKSDAATLGTPEGKNKLAADIVTMLKKPMEKGVEPIKVKSVLFNDFVIQAE